MSYFLDLEAKIPKSLDYFYDDVHYTDKSFDIIADIIFEELITNDKFILKKKHK